jgi:predicted N-acetyltransferase YhbS
VPDRIVRRLAAHEWREYRDVRLRALADAPDAFSSTLLRERGFSDDTWSARLASAADADLPLVAEADGELVGLTWGRIDASEPDVAHLFQMWVAPSHRGLGAGRQLLDIVIRWTQASNARYLDLGVTCGDTPAMRLYTRAGFKPAGDPEPLRPGSTMLAQPMRLDLRQAPNDVIEIRDERGSDVGAIRRVNGQAFAQEREGRIVDALRERDAVLLSLVAVVDDEVVGHILFSPATIGSLVGAALGPMAVEPAHQRRGIGSRLVTAGLEQLDARGCPFVVVVGHPGFYPRFGFESATAFGLTCDWNLPAGVFMVRAPNPATAGRVHGHVTYLAEFSTVE